MGFLSDLGLPFPKHYPQSALLGCVDVVDMVSQENLRAWRARFEALPPDQRDKTDEYMFMDNSEMDFGSHSFGLTSLQPAFVADPFVISAAFVCVNPKRLPVPLAMTGQHKLCTYGDVLRLEENPLKLKRNFFLREQGNFPRPCMKPQSSNLSSIRQHSSLNRRKAPKITAPKASSSGRRINGWNCAAPQEPRRCGDSSSKETGRS